MELLRLHSLRPSNSSTVPSPLSAAPAITPAMWDLNFNYSYHFLFLNAFSSLWANPLLIIHFCEISCEFLSGRQGGHTTAHFAICEWTETHAVTSHRWSRTTHGWSLITCTSEELVSEFPLYAIIANILWQLKSERCFGGTGVFNWTVVTEIHVY